MIAPTKPTVIRKIDFHKFRVLERASLSLSPFNVLIGPNGSGKTTALRALEACGQVASAGRRGLKAPAFPDLAGARAGFSFSGQLEGAVATLGFDHTGNGMIDAQDPADKQGSVLTWFAGLRCYQLNPSELVKAMPIDAEPVLDENGAGLAAVLSHMARTNPERWSALVAEFRRLMPEFADVHAGRTTDGMISFSVTTVNGRHLQSETLSQGTLVLLALLAIVSAQGRPSLLCIEEIERGFHPRLLREVRDLLYRLSFPEDSGEPGPAVQVMATTHSPYVLDLFGDTPEDVILATKSEGAATFRPLSEVPQVEQLLAEGRLGDLWYSGILGGVP